jgi:hypothetical protein
METIVIVTLGVMLIIALLQLRSNNILLQSLTNKLNAEKKANASHILKNKHWQNQIEKLKYNLELNDKALQKAKESIIECRHSKIDELQTKYKSSLLKIVERDEVLRLRDLEITKLEKTKKEYSARVYELSNEKAIAVKETRSAVKLCKESVATIAHLRAELDSMELVLSKYTPQPSLSL